MSAPGGGEPFGVSWQDDGANPRADSTGASSPPGVVFNVVQLGTGQLVSAHRSRDRAEGLPREARIRMAQRLAYEDAARRNSTAAGGYAS